MNDIIKKQQKTTINVEIGLSILGILFSVLPMIISGQWLFLSEIRIVSWNDYMARWALTVWMLVSFLVVEGLGLAHLIGIIRKKHSLSLSSTILFALLFHGFISALCFVSLRYTIGGSSINAFPRSFFVFSSVFLAEAFALVYLLMYRAKKIE